MCLTYSVPCRAQGNPSNLLDLIFSEGDDQHYSSKTHVIWLFPPLWDPLSSENTNKNLFSSNISILRNTFLIISAIKTKLFSHFELGLCRNSSLQNNISLWNLFFSQSCSFLQHILISLLIYHKKCIFGSINCQFTVYQSCYYLYISFSFISLGVYSYFMVLRYSGLKIVVQTCILAHQVANLNPQFAY